MAGIKTELRSLFVQAIIQTFGKEYGDTDPIIQATQANHFGDFQANFALSLSKKMGKNPKEVAEAVLANLKDQPALAAIEVSGPGFLNFKLADSFLERALDDLVADDRLGIPLTSQPQRIIVEYSSPNVAKEMHVGHLRSAVIGDAIARILNFLGHEVIRQNHIGDWGTQFGMLLLYMQEIKWEMQPHHNMSEISQLYRKAKERFDSDADFADQARKQVVALQSGDPQALDSWKHLVAESAEHFQGVYKQLGLLLKLEDVRGESFYNPMLATIVKELQDKGMVTESEGAMTIFLPGFVDRNKEPLPLIIQKTDGGYLYATTDLAAAKFRLEELKADRVIYVVDARQGQHFAMVFAALEQAGWNPRQVQMQHAAFGTVLGKDRKPFKTRSGETVPLTELVDEAINRAATIVADRAELSAEQKQLIAQTIGIAAVKYSDLATDKIKDYVFDWERMLAFEGNTAPYLLNAYVRIRSIFRKAGIDNQQLEKLKPVIGNEQEHDLAIKLLDFSELVPTVAADLALHRLCNYLYELAAAFHKFYEHCPVLNAENEKTKQSRLALCYLTSKTLHIGLGLLGINTLEQM